MPAVRLILGGDRARFLDTVDMPAMPEIGRRFALARDDGPLDLEVMVVEAMQTGAGPFATSEPFAICRRIPEPQS